MELVDFLRARLDEDDQAARGTSGTEWWEHPKNWVSTPPLNRVGLVLHDGDRSHILRHDPARVLAEVDAKRQVIDEYATTCRLRDEAAARIKAAGDSPDAGDLDTWDRAQREAAILEGPVTLLALPFANHPDWKP